MTDQPPESTPTSAADWAETFPSSPPGIMEDPTKTFTGFAPVPPVNPDVSSELMHCPPPPPPPPPQGDQVPRTSATATEAMATAGDDMQPDVPATLSNAVMTSSDADYADDDDKKPEDEFFSEPMDELAPTFAQELAGTALSVPGPPEPAKKGGSGDDIEKGKDGIVKKRSSVKDGKKEKPEMNPKFKDVEETGTWGEISRRELYIAGAIFCVLLVVVLAVVGAMVAKNNNSDPADVEFVPAPTKAPTMPPTNIPADAELALVLDVINQSVVTSQLREDLPIDTAFYEGLMDDATATPQQKAMSWLLYQDELKDPAESVQRWAFASIYYQMGGPQWAGVEGWLGNEPFCTWEHIHCDRGNLQEIDLDGSNLTGSIALEFALLTDVQSILMRRNQITGPIPGAVFAALPSLGFLYLDKNLLTGTVPVALLGNGGLSKCLA